MSLPTSSAGGRHVRSRSTSHPNSIAAFRNAIESGVNRGERTSVFAMQRHAIKYVSVIGVKSRLHSLTGHLKLGLIAGNGRFPFLVLDAARAQGYDVVVAAIKEETFPEIESHGAKSVHWLSLGELSKLIETFQREGVTRAVMAGQVKHKQIFSSIRPDWRLAKLLLSLGTRNTDSLLGAVAKVLGDECIVLENSTWLLEPLLVKAGVLTRRAPTEQEQKNIEYGRVVARRVAQHDIGQTVVIAESACVAVEAMEETDATIIRAGEIMGSLGSLDSGDAALSRSLTVVKVAKPNQDMRFDVPVIG